MPYESVANDRKEEKGTTMTTTDSHCAKVDLKSLRQNEKPAPHRATPFLIALVSLSWLVGLAIPSRAQNLINNGGPVMVTEKAYLIYWLPPCPAGDTAGNCPHRFDPTVAGDGNYTTLIPQFFNDLAVTTYMAITNQYPGSCSSGPCTPEDYPGSVNTAGRFVDTTNPYPHLATTTDPLQDQDIRNEVQTIIQQNSLNPDLNSEFFVLTGAGVHECMSPGVCTFNVFCAYHSSFTSNGKTVLYAFLPDANSLGGGCQEGEVVSPNGQISTDREIAVASHEFIETITDPLGSTWLDAAGNEIGDKCNQQLGPTQPDGSNVNLSGHHYAVQQQWSNLTASCVSGIMSTQYTITTGGDDLRSDSSATSNLQSPVGGSLQTVTLKTQPEPSWNNNSVNERMFFFNQAQSTALGNVALTLTSHSGFGESPDNWDVQALDLRVLDAAGNLLCEQSLSGNPLARLTGSNGTATFATPNCAPPPPPLSFSSVGITVSTGNDNARKDTELWVTFPGEPSMCLKPSNNAEADGTCNNGGSATDQNGQQEWSNWTTSAQTFPLPTPQLAATLNSITFRLIEHNSGFETDDNWDIQGVTVVGIDSSGNSTQLLNVSNPRDTNHNDNCLSRLTGSAGSVTFVLSATNPMGSNPGIPPGSCPQ
jgi:hypothetical protein